jgi:hypothetical protein
MRCLTPIWIKETSETAGTYVPCGRCNNCIQTKRSVWTFRLLMELRVAESAYFVTLTYDSENVPLIPQYGNQLVMSLRREDATLFIKRLRKRILKESLSDSRYVKKSEKAGKWTHNGGLRSSKIISWSPKLRYFMCGEYGGDTNRPHYHIALYNIPNEYVRTNPINGKLYSNVLEEVWNKGLIDIGKLERGSAHYMTKYHMFPQDPSWHESDKRVKPYAVMSRNPGIGINFIDENIRDYFVGSSVGYYTFKNGDKVPLGRYYKDKLDEIFESEKEVRKIKEKLKSYANEKEEIRINSFGSFGDQLEAERDEIREANRKFKRLLNKKGKL